MRFALLLMLGGCGLTIGLSAEPVTRDAGVDATMDGATLSDAAQGDGGDDEDAEPSDAEPSDAEPSDADHDDGDVEDAPLPEDSAVGEDASEDDASTSDASSCDECDDGKVCTDDVCELDGCVHIPNPEANCDDGFSCTTDTCDPINDCGHVVDNAACNDGNECTEDSCRLTGGERDTGCSFNADPRNGMQCDIDADLCSSLHCYAGGCTTVSARVCPFDERCDPITGDCVCSSPTALRCGGSCVEDAECCPGDTQRCGETCGTRTCTIGGTWSAPCFSAAGACVPGTTCSRSSADCPGLCITGRVHVCGDACDWSDCVAMD